MLIRSDAISEAAMGAAKVAREAAQMTFGKLCEMVNALAIVNGDAAYKYIIDRINQLVVEPTLQTTRDPAGGRITQRGCLSPFL